MMNLTSKCFIQKCMGVRHKEQKIREFKKILLRSKRFQKFRKSRIRPNELIKKAAQNMNETISKKYQFAPETIKKRGLNPNKEGPNNSDFLQNWFPPKNRSSIFNL